MLPIPDDIIDSAELWTIAYGISNDSKTLLVSIGETPIRHVIYDLQEDGTYTKVEIAQPEDEHVMLEDILEKEVDSKYILTPAQIEMIANWG